MVVSTESEILVPIVEKKLLKWLAMLVSFWERVLPIKISVIFLFVVLRFVASLSSFQVLLVFFLKILSWTHSKVFCFF